MVEGQSWSDRGMDISRIIAGQANIETEKSEKVIIAMQSEPLRSVYPTHLVRIADAKCAVVRDSPSSSIISITSRSQASPPGDPAPFATTTAVTRATNTQLQSLYRKQAIFSSHHQFASTCLRLNIIPKGLSIKSMPQVPAPPHQILLDHLHASWSQILHRTSIQLLKVLKLYHHQSLQALKPIISSAEQSVAASADSQTLCAAQLARDNTILALKDRRDSKLQRLHPPGHHRKPQQYRRARLRKAKQRLTRQGSAAAPATATPASDISPATNLLVNLSDIPLSNAEHKLLSKGLSFCPTPPNLNISQVLDDAESYFLRL